MKRVWHAGIGLTLGLGPYLAFHQALDGAWWPSTFYAKQAEYAVRLGTPLIVRFFDQMVQPLTGVGILLAPGIICTTVASIRSRSWDRLAPILWVCVHLGAYALRLPVTYQHGRYAMPVIPVLLLLGIEGMRSTAPPHETRRHQARRRTGVGGKCRDDGGRLHLARVSSLWHGCCCD